MTILEFSRSFEKRGGHCTVLCFEKLGELSIGL